MQAAQNLRTQIANYKASGSYSNGKSLGELRAGPLQIPVTDSDLQSLSKAAYLADPPTTNGFALVPALSTYEAKVFVRPGTDVAVVAFKGTDPKRVVDLYTDIRLAQGHLSDTARFTRTNNVLAGVRRALPGYKIITTGHSLGGSLARESSNAPGVVRSVGFNTGYQIQPSSWSGFTRASKAYHKKNHGEYSKFTDYLNDRDIVSVGSRMYGKKTFNTRYKKSWGLKAHKPTYYK